MSAFGTEQTGTVAMGAVLSCEFNGSMQRYP
ncbi:hypothetical protein EC841_1021 [Raoultella ornithinolytica]|uniref:Uncharacterized protein n=1 Tax=Raoultella ornithinolytica TaxID=54291 RepID=A0ABD7QKP1_RAOOR|nr:hypothetical protein EC841_1021 [Raoultella ornithinolytica]